MGETSEFAKIRVPLTSQQKASFWRRSVVMIRQSMDFSLLKNPSFVVFSLQGFFTAYAMTLFYAHNVNRARVYGVTPHQVALLPTTSGLATGVSRIVIGFVGNLKCVNALVLYSVGVLGLSVVHLVYSQVTSYYQLAACGAMFGMTTGRLLATLRACSGVQSLSYS